ncbi:MAG: hypothetical protein LPK79_13955, partial [Bacteroidota bacterium]|nr:hypothetical protein [Bacteroidota bacterium]
LVLLVFRSYSQTHVVTNLSNSGTGSLRDKVASASAGDTITFSPSLFANGSDTLKLNQPIVFTKGLSLHGWMNGGDTLYISGQNMTQIFRLDMTNFPGSQIFIQDCALIDANSSGWGGAVFAKKVDSLMFSGCLFRSNIGSGYGGAIYVDSGGTYIKESQFQNNYLGSITMPNSQNGSYGGGIHFKEGQAIIEDCRFSKNDASNGGAISFYNTDGSEVSNSSFFGNGTTRTGYYIGGGAIMFSRNRNGIVNNCDFIQNTSNHRGGAIAGIRDTNMFFQSCYFEQNQSLWTGGGVQSMLSELKLKDCTFLNNSSLEQGGGIYVYFTDLKLRNSTLIGNQALKEGKGLYLQTCDALIFKCTFHNNTGPGTTYTIDNNSSALSIGYSIWNSIISDPLLATVNSNSNSNYTSLGNNIFSDAPSFTTSLDQVNVDSISLDLEPLGDYGGYAPTRIPGPNSVALDAGSTTDFTDAQNGPVFGIRDIGAAERQKIIADTLLGCSTISWWGNTYSNQGVYYDTIYNANSIDSVGVLVLEGQDTGVVNLGGTLRSLESDPNTAYQWVDCGNGFSPISGATQSTFTPLVNGSYAVVLTHGNCVDTTGCISYNMV